MIETRSGHCWPVPYMSVFRLNGIDKHGQHKYNEDILHFILPILLYRVRAGQ